MLVTNTFGTMDAVYSAQKAQVGINKSINRLATGIRTKFGADPAGQSIADRLTDSAKSYARAARNIEDGLSFAQTAESALMEIGALAQRLFEIGIQAANGDLHSDSDKNALNTEASALAQTINLVATTTKFNGRLVLNADNYNKHINIPVNEAGSSHTITSSKLNTTEAATLTTASVADEFATTLLSKVAEALGNIGASMSALKGAQAVAFTTEGNLTAAASRIQDTDFAFESAELTRNKILNQSSLAMIAQANQAQSTVLSLFQI